MIDLLAEKFYYQMKLIREFEKTLFKLFDAGEITGTTHTYIGQESIAVGIINALEKKDIVISNHRCHGHYIVKNNEINNLLAEIMGKEEGVCKGRGGSQHLKTDYFYSNGVQGNMFPVAAGLALSQKKQKSKNITVIFIGDGTLGEGVIYETLNILGLLKIPLLVILENNKYAQSTSIKDNFYGNIGDRLKGFSIDVSEMCSNDVFEINDIFKNIIKKMKFKRSPHIGIIDTYRLAPHSKGDDDRPKEEINKWWKKDPILLLESKLDKEVINKINQKIDLNINNALLDVKKIGNAKF